jgi:hypothetical protein
MTNIDNLTNSSDQTTLLILPDNSVATLRLRYRQRTQRWIADVGYANKNFQANGINLTCFPNVLRAWRNILPFGIGFMTADFTDPFDINDFQTGRVQAYLLNAADVALVETQIIGRPA